MLISQFLPEYWYVVIDPQTNTTVYNRNETILITGNVSSGDPYNLTAYMNATLDMGTASPADDQTIILYDDGTHGDAVGDDRVFTNEFNISNDAVLGTWTINFTSYTSGLEFLNSTTLTFNVTDVLNVSVNITNKKPIVGSIVIAKIYVKNYRRDAWIPEATINCSYDSSKAVNKTDHNNGTYSVNFTAPTQEGNYILVCNVTKNGNFGNDTDTFAAEPSTTEVNVTVSPSQPSVYGITLYENDSFVIKVNATNLENGTAYATNISLELLAGWGGNSTLENCGDVDKATSCIKGFNITVPNATSPGNYYIYITANWTNLDDSIGSNKTSINITVASNPLINVSEINVSGNATDGKENTIGNFTVLSIGNDVLQNINFDCVSGVVCQNFTVEFIPSSISNIPANSNESVMINVTVPLGFPAGIYTGNVNASAQNDHFDNFTLEVIVLENRSWELSPQYCERSTQQSVGTVCEVNVTNKGNAQINFTISPEEGNYTKVNETSFVVNRSSWHVFRITYNTTGVSPGIYNSTFVVDAVQSNADPDNRTVMVSLLPYIPPIINISITPNETEENGTIRIVANVTDRSGSNIAWTKVNITTPNGTVYNLSMFIISSSGNLTVWELMYPNGTNGSTLKRGMYNLTVYAKDNVGNEGYSNSSFLIYLKFDVSMSALSNTYYQGDTGSIYYVVRNLTNDPLTNITVNFTIEDSQGNITYLSSNFQTNSDGSIAPLPSFSILSDAPIGNYSLYSYSTYFDSLANKRLEKQNNYTFEVLSRTITVTGLFADVETAVVWYPDNIMRFGILIYNGEGRPVDPTSIDLAVYDPADNLYFATNMSQMTKEATGYYTYQYAMPSNTPSGMFLSVLNVTQGSFQSMKLKAFRVAHGGPYDVRINLLENEVEQGSYLDFVLIIENKGEVSQDVYVEYWISSEGNTYYSASEAIYTPALNNQSVTRSAYIYSNQPLGNYLLNVRVTYDNVQPPILSNASFTVVAAVTTTTTSVVPGAAPTVVVPSAPTYRYLPIEGAFVPKPTERIIADILISKYESNISLARAFTKLETVVVNNTGEVDLNNVSLVLLGIPTDWFNITPTVYKTLEKGNSSVFLITFTIPKNAKIGNYGATLIASSGVVSDKKSITITVFESMEELLREEIKKLKESLQDLQVETKVAEREGKDVSGVLLILGEIKSQISLAETNLEDGEIEKSLENIANAKNLIERAWDLLNRLKVTRLRGFILPLWMIILLVVSVTIISFLITFIILRRRKKEALKPWPPLQRLVDRIRGKKVSREEIIKEKEKLLRMLKVLEKEKNEKLISIGAYEEMKKSIEKKLLKIEKKLKHRS